MSDDRSLEVVRELLHAVDGIALRADPETLAISYVTDDALRLGWPRDAWISQKFWSEILHPADAMSTAALFRATARDGADRRGVHRVRTSSGEDRWFSTRVRAMRRDDGTVEKLVALMTDITDARIVSAAFHETDLYRTVLNQLPAVVYTTDCDLRLTTGVGAALAKLGIRPGQLFGVTVSEYLQTEHGSDPILSYHHRALGGEVVTFDAEHHGVVFETTVGPLRDASGAVTGTLGVAHDVTELRRAARERAEQEERLRKLGEVSFEALVLHDQGRIIVVNGACCRLFGLRKPDEAVGQNLLDFVAPGSRDLVANQMRAGSEEPYDAVGVRTDGVEFEATFHSRNTHYRERPVRVTSIRDITARKQMEQQLRYRAAEWEATLKAITDGVVVFDREGSISFVNDAGARATGANAGAIPVQSREKMLRLQGRDGTPFAEGEELSARVLRGQTIAPVEIAYVGRAGLRRVARVTGAPIHVGGERIGGVLVAHDITRMKEYLAEREKLLREVTDHATKMKSILDQLVDGVLVVTRDGAIELANREACRLLGLSQGARVPIGQLMSRERGDGGVTEPHAAEVAYRRACAGEVVRNLQFHAIDAVRGWLSVRVNAGPIRDGRGDVTGVVIVMRDVSDLNDFEEMKDQFIRVAAHELKTPVAVMKGYAQLLLRGEHGAPRAPLEAIERGANRIDRVVQELLDVSQLRLGTLTITPEIIDLAALVKNIVEHAPRTPRHRVRIVRSTRAKVRGDRHRLEFVVANLLDNAIRYSPAGGDIDVSLDVEDGFARVSVRDYGVGIARAKQPRIFERFYRAHTDTAHDYGGIGVALALSREIIERHGGSMTFESTEGVGSTFTFRVPIGADNGCG
jgi:PAS domain S-box-containing protein